MSHKPSLNHFEAPSPEALAGLGELRALGHRYLELKAFEKPDQIWAAIEWLDRLHYIVGCRAEAAKHAAKKPRKKDKR